MVSLHVFTRSTYSHVLPAHIHLVPNVFSRFEAYGVQRLRTFQTKRSLPQFTNVQRFP